MELELGVQITGPVGGLTFVSTETDAVFILFAHLPGFMKDEIEVELNEAGTEISISSRGEIGERSFIDAEILRRIRISHHELMEGFRKAFPIPNNVALDQIEVVFEEEEDILIVLLPKSTREEEPPSGVEIEEINEENIREEEEEDDDDEERTSMTIEAEETSPDYKEEKAQEQQNLGEVEPKNSTDKLEGKPDGKPEAGPREATTKIAIKDKEDSGSELIIEELDFTITPSISKEPSTSKSEEEEEEEEEAPEQKNLNELEVSKSLEALESEAEGETEPESKEIAIGAQIDDKEDETGGLIIEEMDFTIIPLPLEEPIIFETSEVEEKDKEEEEEEEKRLEEKEQKQRNLYELEPRISSGESAGEPDEEIEPQCKEITIEAEIIDDDEEKNKLIIEEPDFTTPPPQEEQIALKASGSKEEEKKIEEEEEEEKATKEKVSQQKNLDELEPKKISEVLRGEPDGKTRPEYREITTEAQTGDKEEEKAGPIKEESDFTRTSPSEEPVASKISELKEKEEKPTREEVPKQNDLDKLEPKKILEALEGEFDGKTKQEHREMTIDAQTGDKEKEKTGLIREEPDFTRTLPPSEEPVTSKAFELKEENEKATDEGVSERQDLDELKPKKILKALEGESDGKTKSKHREMTTEVQSGDKEEKKIRFIIEKPDFTRIPLPSEKPIASKTFELKEKEEKATWQEVLEQKDLDELAPKKISKALESEYDGKTKPKHREMVIEAQTGDKKEEKIRPIKEEPEFSRTPPPSEELIASKAFELKEEDEKAIGEEVPEQKDELEQKKILETLEDVPDGKTKLEHREMAIEAQTGDKEEEKIGLIREEPDFTRTPPPSEKPVASKVSELKEKEDQATREEVSEQKDLGEPELKKISKVLESESDGKTKPKHREMAIEAQIGDKKEEKTILIRDEPDFIITPPLSEKLVASKTFKLKEEEEKTTGEEVSEHKDLDELGPKKISEALEDESDRKTKPGYQEMTIKAQTGNKKKEKIRLIREEPDFTRISPPSEESIVSKALELKEEEKTTGKEVLEQKDLGELESKKNLEVPEDEFDGKIKPEYQEMTIEARTGDKEEKNGLTKEELDFTRTSLPSEKPIASKAFELKEKEKKAIGEKVPEKKDLDELELKKILEELEGEPCGKTKSEHREMTIEAQIGNKEEEKACPTREESDFTRTSPSEEPVSSKIFELKEKEEKPTREEVQKQNDLDKLEPKKISEALEGEFDGKTKQEHREMTIEAQTEDQEKEKTGLIREEPDFTRTLPPSEESVTSKAFELKEENEKATEERVSEQQDLDELKPKKILKALEGESDGKIKPEHREMTTEVQSGDKEEKKIGFIIEEPDFTRIPLPSEKPIASKTFELKEKEEKAAWQEVLEQKDLDELAPKKISKALESEYNGKTKPEHQEMVIETQTGDKEEKIRLIKEEPGFSRTPPPSEELIASKAFELKEDDEKAIGEEIPEQKDLDKLEAKKILETLEDEPDGKTKLEHREMTIEAQIGDKEEEKIRLITEKPDFTSTPPPSEKPVASKVSELKEKEDQATREEISEQKDLGEPELKKISKVLESESDGKTKPKHQEMAIEAQIGDKKEEKTILIRDEPDFIVTPPLAEKSVASKTFKLKEEEEKTTGEEVSEQKDLDELRPKQISEVLEDETKLKHQEMTIEAQTGNKKEEKIGLTREEPNFTETFPPSEESVVSKAFKLQEEEEKATEKEVPEHKDLGELESKKISKVQEDGSDGKAKPKYQEMTIEAQTDDKEEEKNGLTREEPDFTRTPSPSEKPVASKVSELKEKEDQATREEITEQKDLGEPELKKISKVLESESDGKTKPKHQEMAIEAQIGDKKEEKTILIRDEPDFIVTPPLSEKPVASKTFKLKEEEEKTTGEEVSEQKDLDELRPKQISEVLEDESDKKTKPKHQEMIIEAQTGNKKEEKIGLTREEPNFTETFPPSEESVVSKAFKLQEEEEKVTEKKVPEQKDLGELESKKISKVQEDGSDGKAKPKYQEMTIEAQTDDKEEEKNGLTREEPDFTRTPPPSEELVASKGFEPKEKEEKAPGEEVLEQKDLDELESKKILKGLEDELDGKIKPEYGEMAIEVQTGAKEEEKTGLIREEPYFTRTHLPSEESVASKASELKGEEEKTTGEEVSEQKNLDELDQKKNSKALEGESDGKIKSEHREMVIKAQTGDKEEEKTKLIREAPDFTRTPLPLKEPVASKAFELKEEEENATRKEVPKQDNLNGLKPKKNSKALEGETDGKTKPKHQEMAIEAQTGAEEEEKTGLIRAEPYFTRTPLPSEEPLASKASELKEEKEKVLEKEVSKQKYLYELEPKKISEALEGDSDGKTKREHREMAIEEQTGDKEEKIRLIREKPDFFRPPLPSEELVASKASDMKEEEEKATEKKVQEQKDLDKLELEKGLEASKGEPNGEIESKPIEMAIEAPSEHKEEEQTRIHTEKPEFTIAPPVLEKPIVSNASKLKEEEEEKAHKENAEEPKSLKKKIQSKIFDEEKEEKEENAIEEKSQEQKSLDELQVKKSSEEIEGEPFRETKPEPKKIAIETQTKYKEEEETRRITEEPGFTVSPPPLEDLIASKAPKSKKEKEEQYEKAPTEETPYLPPISPNIMAKPESNEEQPDTIDSHEERDQDVEVPGRALETFESTESSKQEEDRHGFGKENAKEPKNVEEITHDPAPKTLTRTVTAEDVDFDRRRDGEHEARETKIRTLREDDREIVSDVDGGEVASREWEEGESSDRDREESRGEIETRTEEEGNDGNEMNGMGENAQRKRRRRRKRRKRVSSFHLPPADVIAGSVFILSLAALVIRLIKKRGSHTMR